MAPEVEALGCFCVFAGSQAGARMLKLTRLRQRWRLR
jgi:hypothetical protein